MGILNRTEIFEEGALKTEVINLTKGDVIVSQIGGGDFITLWSNPKYQKKDENDKDVIDMSRFTPALIAYSVVDEGGEKIFTEADIEKLAKFNQDVFLKLAKAAQRLNGITGEEVKNSDDSQPELQLSASA